jgi:hypothetical protein
MGIIRNCKWRGSRDPVTRSTGSSTVIRGDYLRLNTVRLSQEPKRIWLTASSSGISMTDGMASFESLWPLSFGWGLSLRADDSSRHSSCNAEPSSCPSCRNNVSQLGGITETNQSKSKIADMPRSPQKENFVLLLVESRADRLAASNWGDRRAGGCMHARSHAEGLSTSRR